MWGGSSAVLAERVLPTPTLGSSNTIQLLRKAVRAVTSASTESACRAVTSCLGRLPRGRAPQTLGPLHPSALLTFSASRERSKMQIQPNNRPLDGHIVPTNVRRAEKAFGREGGRSIELGRGPLVVSPKPQCILLYNMYWRRYASVSLSGACSPPGHAR